MTNTLFGYMVYRLQDKLRELNDTNGYTVDISYSFMETAIIDVLVELTKDMENGESISLPDGSELTLTWKVTRKVTKNEEYDT